MTSSVTSKKYIAAAPVAFLLFAAYCLCWFYLPPAFNSSGYLASIIDKHRALDRARSPKIVFVGGSNLAYGLDSDAVSAALGRDVVNMGVSRLFGLRYCLEEVKDSLHQGDMVVIVPEYENFYGELNGSSHLMAVPTLLPAAAVWVLRSYATSPGRIVQLCTDIEGVLNFKWNWWRQHLYAFLQNPTTYAVGSVPLYNMGDPKGCERRNFTARGDLIGHLDQPPPSVKYMKMFADCRLKSVDPEAIRVMNEFAGSEARKGVATVLIPPPVPRPVYEEHRAQIDQAIACCKRRLVFPVLAEAGRYTFAEPNFFNGLYHLHGTARDARTAMVVRDLSNSSIAAVRTVPEQMQ